MKKLITRSIGLILVMIFLSSCKEEIAYLAGFGLSENQNSSNVKNFPVYFQQMQTWAKDNNFVLKSSKLEKGKVIEIYNGSFRSLGAVSLEISTRAEEGKEFIMYKVNFLKPVLKTEKTFGDMNEFQSQLQTIIPSKDNKKNPG